MRQLKSEGLCCASIIVKLGLELRGEENEQFVRASSALCNGMQSGMTCGALSGAVCMLGLFDAKNIEMISELARWFENECSQKYPSTDCKDIVCGDTYKKAAICPSLVLSTYQYAKELLIEFGYINSCS